MKFFFVRHAPVVGQKGKVYGDNVQIDLNNNQDKIKKLSDILPKTNEALWFYSGVDRTLKTAKSVLGMRESKFNLIKNEFFKEQNFGDLIGQSHTDASPHLQWINGNMLAANPPNGETISDLKMRVEKGIEEVSELARNNSIENIVVFCHRGTIRVANMFFYNLSVDNFLDIDIETLDYKIYEYSF